jgi:general secretion pathway protein C
MLRSRWITIATFLIWLLAAASGVFWVLQFVKGPASPLSAAVAAPSLGSAAVDAQALAKGLGGGYVAPRDTPGDTASNAAPPAPSVFQAARFVLTGVIVSKSTNPSVALIAVDGKPPRPYRVGTTLADGIVLHSVSAGKAMLSASMEAAPGLTLELPQITSAVAGTAVASRPAFSALALQPTPAPVPVPPPISAPANNPMTNPVASPAANPTPAPGQRPPRLGANRPREAEKEAQGAAAPTP